MKNEKRPTVAVSGGFSPPTNEQVMLLKMASKLGDVVVYLNSDAWCDEQSSTGKTFMTFARRRRILKNLPYVKSVVAAKEDEDGSVSTEISNRKPTFFAKGFWTSVIDLPEMEICKKAGTCVVWFVQNTPEFNPHDAAADLGFAIRKAK